MSVQHVSTGGEGGDYCELGATDKWGEDGGTVSCQQPPVHLPVLPFECSFGVARLVDHDKLVLCVLLHPNKKGETVCLMVVREPCPDNLDRE